MLLGGGDGDNNGVVVVVLAVLLLFSLMLLAKDSTACYEKNFVTICKMKTMKSSEILEMNGKDRSAIYIYVRMGGNVDNDDDDDSD
uniref:Uncharacterized protein n=1 Tax=Wuchereria bancrofti TaxID=6293 RepID=A0AAF5PUT1_WUCBA